MKVMKFGGSSVKDAAIIKEVCRIVLEENKKEPVAVVLSAMKGITDLLIETAKKAESGNQDYHKLITEIRSRKDAAIKELIPGKEGPTIKDQLFAMIQELEDILLGIELVKECSLRSMGPVMSFGERLNCKLVAGYLNSIGVKAEYVDSRDIVRTNDNHGSAAVNFPVSYELIEKRLKSSQGIPIITGFIGSTDTGVTTTLGRNGSDYTGSIIGAGIDASVIEIWTDVDGVLSADPRYVKGAFVIPEVSFEEAMELSFSGAKVIHPYTMIPAVEKNIPILIKNTMNPEAPGTYIKKDVVKHPNEITSIASIEKVALINIVGGGMVGKPGVASKIFSSLARAKVNVIMISQASSEHSICVICKEQEADRAISSLKKDLATEIESHAIQNFELIGNLEVISIIGENMRGTPGISGKLFSALGQKKINVLVIAQGSSERNISFVINSDQRIDALNTIHKAFLGV